MESGVDNTGNIRTTENAKAKDANPLARLDIAMDNLIRVAEDFVIRTSYKTDKKTSRDIANLKTKKQSLLAAMQLYRQRFLEIRKGYVFLTAQLDEIVNDIDVLISEEKNNG